MSQTDRVISLDQFRGYSVAGMFVVNFLGHIASTHHLLKHNNTHFSLADSIMPSFILICGYSYRMTFVKRASSQSSSQVVRRYLWRSLGLILLSVMFFGFGSKIASFENLSLASITKVFIELIKANLWEVLAIIGACQILLLPVISLPARHRIATLLGLTLAHVGLTWWFNWNFVYGLPNGLDNLLGTTGKRAWDGGFFGLLAWSEIMLLGTFLPDLIESVTKKKAVVLLLLVGSGLMSVGYLASCLTRLYDKPAIQQTSDTATTDSVSNISNAEAQFESPVIPNWSKLKGRSWQTLLAEPPLVPPPGKEVREPNYWAMDKRIVSQSFVYFSAGFAVFLYGLFVLVCDIGSFAFKPLTTFGQNPLAAYLIHHTIAKNIESFFPKDSSALWGTIGMLISMAITYLFVRFLEARGLFLRL